eukprot:s1225_g10.t1
MHEVLSESFHAFAMTRSSAFQKHASEQTAFQTHVENKWLYWRTLRALNTPCLSSFFTAWRCWSRFHQLRKEQAGVATQSKLAKIQALTQQAGVAASRNDLFRLYHLINQFSPKQQRSRIRLRTAQGAIASPAEELAILKTYVQRTWYDSIAPSMLLHCDPIPPGVPFAEQELALALQQAPIVKAVAYPYPPNLMWRLNAVQIASIVYTELQKWWSVWPPHIPAVWQRGWLAFIGKPNRPPNCPSNLRALAMQEPVGKAILQILTEHLQRATFPTLCTLPQMAYMHARDTQDAVIRVLSHCNAVKQLLTSQADTLRNQRQGDPRLACFGGIQLFVDLEKAFDTAPRCAILKALQLLEVPQPLISLFCAWHSQTSHVVNHNDCEDVIPTNKGVRQGCVAAPSLWTCLMYYLMQTYGLQVPRLWLCEHLTIFADDVHLCQLIRNATDLQTAIDRFGAFFQCVLDLGLRIHCKKTEVLLRLAGSQSTLIQSRHILRTAEGVFLKIPYGNGLVAHVPMVSSHIPWREDHVSEFAESHS